MVTGSSARHSPHALTERQQEVLQQVAEEKNTKEIAYRLKLSVKTIESHRAQLMKRLNIHDVAGLVGYAIRTGLVRPEVLRQLQLQIDRASGNATEAIITFL